jgi:hypothetical protein
MLRAQSATKGTAYVRRRMRMVAAAAVASGFIPALARLAVQAWSSATADDGAPYTGSAFGSTPASAAVYVGCLLADVTSLMAVNVSTHFFMHASSEQWRQVAALRACVDTRGSANLKGAPDPVRPGLFYRYDADPIHPCLPLDTVGNIRAYIACRRLLMVHQRRMAEFGNVFCIPGMCVLSVSGAEDC